MKLHSLLLTAALFISATVSFAAIETITTIKDGQTYTGYAWAPTYNPTTITVTLKHENGPTNNPTWAYELFSYEEGKSAEESSWTYKLTADNAIGAPIHMTGQEQGWVYKFEVPLTDANGVRYDIKKIGIVSDKTETDASVSTVNIPGNGDFFYYISKTRTLNDGTISYGNLTGKDNKEHMKAEFTFGQPLPAPVVTLLIALGFGAALVIYRNRKQAKA